MLSCHVDQALSDSHLEPRKLIKTATVFIFVPNLIVFIDWLLPHVIVVCFDQALSAKKRDTNDR